MFCCLWHRCCLEFMRRYVAVISDLVTLLFLSADSPQVWAHLSKFPCYWPAMVWHRSMIYNACGIISDLVTRHNFFTVIWDSGTANICVAFIQLSFYSGHLSQFVLLFETLSQFTLPLFNTCAQYPYLWYYLAITWDLALVRDYCAVISDPNTAQFSLWLSRYFFQVKAPHSFFVILRLLCETCRLVTDFELLSCCLV